MYTVFMNLITVLFHISPFKGLAISSYRVVDYAMSCESGMLMFLAKCMMVELLFCVRVTTGQQLCIIYWYGSAHRKGDIPSGWIFGF